MKKTRQVSIEYTFRELSLILMRHIQDTQKVEIKRVDFNSEPEKVIFYGDESQAPGHPTVGIDLAETILLPPKAKDKKNRGLTKFLRQTFSTEEKFHLNHLSELINKSGFEVPRSTLKYNYLNSLLKEVVVEVSPDVYQLKSGYDKIHNREETITQSA